MQIPLDEPFIIGDFSSGLIDDLSVSSLLMPKNAVGKCINGVFNRPRGSVSQRYGYTKVGNSASANTVVGLYNFRTSGGTNLLFQVAGTVLYRLVGGTWTSTVTGLTSGLKTRFITYLDNVALMNGTDAVQGSTNGTAFSGSGGNIDVANFPVAKFATILNTRILAAGVTSAPDTVFASSLEASGSISWTSGQKSFKVGALDGTGSITGITGNSRLALIFKNRSLYRYDDNELQRIAFVGTPSHESIVTDDNGITYFFGTGSNGTGFYATDGGRPVKISRMITRYVEAISPSFYANVCAYTNGSEVEWSIGSITIGDNTYTNASIVYSISDKTWTIYSRADRFRVFASYIDGSDNLTVVGGDTDGDVHTINSGNTDNSSPIFSELELTRQSYTTRGRMKTISELLVYAEHFQGLTLHVKVDGGSFVQIGTIEDNNHHFSQLRRILRGHQFTYKFTAVNSGTPWVFEGIEHPAGSIIDDGYRA